MKSSCIFSILLCTGLIFKRTHDARAQDPPKTSQERLIEKQNSIDERMEADYMDKRREENSSLNLSPIDFLGFFSDMSTIESFTTKINEYRRQGKLEETLPLINSLITLYPNQTNFYNIRGRTYSELGNGRESIKDFKKAIALDSAFDQPYAGLALEYFKGGFNKDALENINKAISIRPNMPNYYSVRGDVNIQLKNYKGAINDLNRAVTLNPYKISNYLSRGIALFNSDQASMAQKEMLHIYRNVSDSNENYFHWYAQIDRTVHSDTYQSLKNRVKNEFKLNDTQTDSILLAEIEYWVRRHKIGFIDKKLPEDIRKAQGRDFIKNLNDDRKGHFKNIFAEDKITDVHNFITKIEDSLIKESREQLRSEAKKELSLTDLQADSVMVTLLKYKQKVYGVRGGPVEIGQSNEAIEEIQKLIKERNKILNDVISKDQIAKIELLHYYDRIRLTRFQGLDK